MSVFVKMSSARFSGLHFFTFFRMGRVRRLVAAFCYIDYVHFNAALRIESRYVGKYFGKCIARFSGFIVSFQSLLY